MNGPLLVPGIGAQGGTADDVRRIFGDVLDLAPALQLARDPGRRTDPAALRAAVGRSVDAFSALGPAADAAVGAAVLAVLLLGLAGCGDPIEDYCSQLREDRKEFAEMLESESSSALLGNLPMLHDLAEKSPDDLSDDWQTICAPTRGWTTRSRTRGSSRRTSTAARRRPGSSKAEQQAIAEAAGQITTEEVITAATNIEQQARDVCKVNPGL